MLHFFAQQERLLRPLSQRHLLLSFHTHGAKQGFLDLNAQEGYTVVCLNIMRDTALN